MRKYIARRLVLMVPTLFIFSLLVFGLLRVLPGDVAEKMLIDDSGAQTASKASLERLREKLGLNRPLYVQYLSWVGDTVRGDFGVSLLTGRSVIQDLKQRLPLTVQLALMSLIFSTCVGVPIGIISAVKQNSLLDYGLRFFSIFFLAAPGFWVALMVILAGAFWFGWVPTLGYNLLWQQPMANLSQLGVPALILGLSAMASKARYTRSSMLEVLREDYIRTARSKGLREQVVIVRHAMKNAMIPVLTVIGLQFGAIMGGSVILESIFGIPGMGTYLITAIRRSDYTVVQSVVVVFALMFMSTNLVIDLLYGWLDPRISYA
ncbi:MAG: ABC transporter permease [Dehalococcoidia bacterium]|nr:ABC transporter permease [Dehalococcoidia bacterium]